MHDRSEDTPSYSIFFLSTDSVDRVAYVTLAKIDSVKKISPVKKIKFTSF